MSYVVRNSHGVDVQPVDKSSSVTGENATRKMAKHVANLKYEMLPAKLVDLM